MSVRLSVLKKVVDKAFKGGQNQYVNITKYQANWSNKKNKENIVTKDEIFSMIDILIDNTYFQLGNSVYRQIIGIPMGIDPAPHMANLYLYHDEFVYMEKLTKVNYGKALKYNNTQRFIDDLFTMNNDGILEQDKDSIYHKDLQLNKENTSNEHATFLDLDIAIENGYVTTKTYDKREDFNFEIVSFPDLGGNIPERSAYGIFTAQIIRHAKNCSQRETFIARTKQLVDKLVHKGFQTTLLRKTMERCLEEKRWIIVKYQCNQQYLQKHIWGEGHV